MRWIAVSLPVLTLAGCVAWVFASSVASADRSPSGCLGGDAGTIAFERMVYLTEESGSDVTDIWVVDADGAHQRKLTGGDRVFFEGRPAWSPDGRRIAYVSYASGGGIFVMNRDGGGTRRLTRRLAWDPTWSPSGRIIAFATDNGPLPGSRIGVVGARGGPVRLWTPERYDAGEPDWSSTGLIVFVHPTGRTDATMEVYGMSPGGRVRSRLTKNREREATPAWSPDGKEIAFHTERGIYVMNADGSGARRLTQHPEDYGPAWSPDGRCIAFGRDGTEIYVVSSSGGAPEKLMRKPKGAYDRAPAWSPSRH